MADTGVAVTHAVTMQVAWSVHSSPTLRNQIQAADMQAMQWLKVDHIAGCTASTPVA